MVDQSTNRQSVRNLSQKPLPSHKHSSQSLSPSQQSTRVTRSRSRDVLDAQAREPIPSRKRRKMADDEEIVVNSSTQANKVRKRGARSKHLQGLSTVTEELGGKGTGVQGEILQKPGSPGASSPISESVMELSAAEPKVTPLKSTSSRLSNISFHAPKNLKPAARHLFQRKLGSVAAKTHEQEQAQEEVEDTRTTESTTVAETTAIEIASLGKSRDEYNQVSQPDGPQIALRRNHEEDDSWRLQEFGEGDEEVLVASEKASPSTAVARARQVMELQANRDAQNNRENVLEDSAQQISKVKRSFIDRQDNAERVSFESQEEVQAVSENQGQRQRHLRRKDSAVGDVPAEEVEELGTEEEFQQDQRQITRQTRRGKTSSGKRSAPAPSVRRHLPEEDLLASTDGGPSDNIRSAPIRHDQEQTLPPSQFVNYMNANKLAKFKNSSQVKGPQKRKAWTNEETEALIKLIEEYGTSWAFLKQRDEMEKLKFRDQVALKDKARNMKFDFLKAGTFLPLNFDNIPLNKLQTEKLREMGINYYVSNIRDDEDQ